MMAFHVLPLSLSTMAAAASSSSTLFVPVEANHHFNGLAGEGLKTPVPSARACLEAEDVCLCGCMSVQCFAMLVTTMHNHTQTALADT